MRTARCWAWQPDPDTGRHLYCDRGADHDGDHMTNGRAGRYRWTYWPDYAGLELVRARAESVAEEVSSDAQPT